MSSKNSCNIPGFPSNLGAVLWPRGGMRIGVGISASGVIERGDWCGDAGRELKIDTGDKGSIGVWNSLGSDLSVNGDKFHWESLSFSPGTGGVSKIFLSGLSGDRLEREGDCVDGLADGNLWDRFSGIGGNGTGFNGLWTACTNSCARLVGAGSSDELVSIRAKRRRRRLSRSDSGMMAE